MAPELRLGYFGGDPDNFTYPRYSLDFAFLRLYDDDDRPLRTDDHFRWSETGTAAGDLVFIIGNPGSTSRLQTVAELEFRRDVEMPALLGFLGSRIEVIRNYMAGREDEPGIDEVRNTVFSLLNAQKAYSGMLRGLEDPYVLARRGAAEADFRGALQADPALAAEYLPLFGEMAGLQSRKAAMAAEFDAFAAFGSPDFESSLILRTLATFQYLNARAQGASPEELDEIADELRAVANRPRELDEALLAARHQDMVDAFGEDDPSVRALLRGRGAEEAASLLMTTSAMGDSAAAVGAVVGGTLNPGTEPAFAFVRSLLGRFGPYRDLMAGVVPEEEAIAAGLGRARFEVDGTRIPPDATFSLRLADGVVAGYPYNGTVAPTHTTYYGLYDRHHSNPGADEWALPPRWLNPSSDFDLSTPLNFVSTADIIGGNSGSPVVNRDLEVVGLVFDGNIQSLPGDYIYMPALNRSVAVDARGILEALEDIYGAERIVEELTGGRGSLRWAACGRDHGAAPLPALARIRPQVRSGGTDGFPPLPPGPPVPGRRSRAGGTPRRGGPGSGKHHGRVPAGRRRMGCRHARDGRASDRGRAGRGPARRDGRPHHRRHGTRARHDLGRGPPARRRPPLPRCGGGVSVPRPGRADSALRRGAGGAAADARHGGAQGGGGRRTARGGDSGAGGRAPGPDRGSPRADPRGRPRLRGTLGGVAQSGDALLAAAPDPRDRSPVRPGRRRLPGAGEVGAAPGGDAGVRAGRAPGQHPRARVDGGRPGRHAPTSGVGRRRYPDRPSGPAGRRADGGGGTRAGSGPREGRGPMSGTGDGTGLAARFRDHLTASGRLEGAERAVVAVSGGIDSMTLLHLLRFGHAAPSLALRVAHLDHRMRAESGADAAWLGEVCAAWGVAYHLRAAATPVRTEAEGRELRYRFFGEVADGAGSGTVVLTGHTADDQAETVLFRIARGSGPRGLGGIHPGRCPSPVRPLLPFRRAEVEAYAAARGVPHREDPTNRDPRWTRNRLRHEVLPALEAAVPGAAASLVALAGTSRLESAALDRLLDDRIAALASAPSGSAPELSFDREALAALPDPVLTVLLRRVATRLGGSPGRGASASLPRFVREAPSGRRLELAGGVTVEHHLGVLRFGGPADGRSGSRPPPDPRPVAPNASGLPATHALPRVRVEPPSGEGAFTHGACGVTVSWQTADGVPPGRDRPTVPGARADAAADRRGSGDGSRSPFVAHFAPGGVRFPLDVRPWAPGDRMTLPYGRKKVKKILLEARVPADRRRGWPVVADADGSIVWVPGSARPSLDPGSAPQTELLRLEVGIRS